MTFASRNLALCTKDCVCLFICPTGATDTPNGQIDSQKCLDGCRFCVDACPSHAISLVFSDYPEPAKKDTTVYGTLMELCASKTEQEADAEVVAGNESLPDGARRLARAIRKSARILAEDCAREAGYLIPQCEASRKLLEKLES